MAILKPFQSIRPTPELAAQIAALPYDVYTEDEARTEAERTPLSFLSIDRPETQFPKGTDPYLPAVYQKAKELLDQMIADGSFIKEDSACYYIYALTLMGHTQTGLVGCASIDDYLTGTIRKHENTREDKELDRICHVDACDAQTGPIFMAYRSHKTIQRVTGQVKKTKPLYDFTSEDGVQHKVWKVCEEADLELIRRALLEVPRLYIADGHHRAASAVKVGLKRRASSPGYDGTEQFNFFLTVLFPAEELRIFDYNRIVKELNGYTFSDFIDTIRSDFEVTCLGNEAFRPEKKGEFGLYGNGKWYRLEAKPSLRSHDPVDGLDVSLLQNVIFGPLLGIRDIKTDTRVIFSGGSRGIEALAKTVDMQGDGAAFALFPTSMEELLAVADAGRLMPPKSTWFEPKLRSGLFIHQF